MCRKTPESASATSCSRRASAWPIASDDKTVIRAGYGINYDPIPFSRPLRGWYPLVVNSANVASNGYTWASTFQQGVPNTSGSRPFHRYCDAAGERQRAQPVGRRSTAAMCSPLTSRRAKAAGQYHRVRRLRGIALRPHSGGPRHQFRLPGFGHAGLPLPRSYGRTISLNMWDGYLSAELQFAAGGGEPQLFEGPDVEGRLHLLQGHRLHR